MLLSVIATVMICDRLTGASSDETECFAGAFWDKTESKCRPCKDNTDVNDTTNHIHYFYSEDGASTCRECEKLNERCYCDNTPSVYFIGALYNDIPADCVNACTKECYHNARYYLDATNDGGRISDSEQFIFIPCPCSSESSCESQELNHNCLLNDCDKPLNGSIASILSGCYTGRDSPCDEKCFDDLSEHLPKLRECNCYYAEEGTSGYEDCDGYRNYYLSCTAPPSIRPTELLVVLAVIALFVLFLACFALKLFVVSSGRKLKRVGNLSSILPYIDMSAVKAIGTAHEVICNNVDQYTLAEREILVKIKFSALNRFGFRINRIFKSHHVVVKIFSNSRSEFQRKEMEVFNLISDKDTARKNNIISVYGPDECNYKSGVREFLEEVVNKAPRFSLLKDVINDYYDERSKCILMNHCNELSLYNFSKYKYSGTLPEEHIITLCTDLAKALNFLHHNDPVIVHCDIKPHNIFVKIRRKRTSFILGDFGFAETHTAGEIWRLRGSTTAFLPPEWMISVEGAHPELWSSEQIKAVQEKDYKPNTVDIYQYGLIVWLVLHGKSDPWLGDPEYDMASQESTRTGDPEVIRKCLGNMFLRTFDKRPQFNYNGHVRKMTRNVFQGLQAISELCWQVNLNQRPAASYILDRLEQLINNPKNVKFNMCHGNSERSLYNYNNKDITLVDLND